MKRSETRSSFVTSLRVTRRAVCTTPLLLLLSVFRAGAQSRPNFTGTWQMDVTRSPASSGGPIDTWTVVHDDSTLALVNAHTPGDHRVYRLDGTPTEITNDLTGRWTFRTTWMRDRLEISSEGENPNAASSETWYLDGDQLVIEWRRTSLTGRSRMLVNRYNKIEPVDVSRKR